MGRPQIPSTQTPVDPLDLIRQMTPDRITALRSLLSVGTVKVERPFTEEALAEEMAAYAGYLRANAKSAQSSYISRTFHFFPVRPTIAPRVYGDASLRRIVNIAYPHGPEFDIMDLVTRVPVEPARWWRVWFQDALDAIMKFTPARTRTYFIRLVVVPFVQPAYPFAIEIMNTSWAGDPEYQWALALDPSIAASPDLLSANAPATEPPRTPTARLRFAAALRHELIHLTKHRVSHKKGPLAIEPEAHAGQRDFICRAARYFGVPPAERDRLKEENEQAERERLASLRGNP